MCVHIILFIINVLALLYRTQDKLLTSKDINLSLFVSYYNKIPEQKQLKGDKVYSGLFLEEYSPS